MYGVPHSIACTLAKKKLSQLLRGVIPSEGHVAVEVQFTPRALSCASCELLVSVSQLNFKPFTCAITGSSVAGLTRNNMLAALQEGFDAEETSRARDEALALPAGGTLKGDVGEMSSYRGPLDVSTRPVGAGSGAVADWGGAHVAARRIKPASGKMEIILPKFRPPSPQTEVEGLQIPAHLEGPFATNFIITQQPGKLKPKDLKAAIDEQRALRKKQKEQQEALRAAQGHGESIPGQVAYSTVVSVAQPSSGRMDVQKDQGCERNSFVSTSLGCIISRRLCCCLL